MEYYGRYIVMLGMIGGENMIDDIYKWVREEIVDTNEKTNESEFWLGYNVGLRSVLMCINITKEIYRIGEVDYEDENEYVVWW